MASTDSTGFAALGGHLKINNPHNFDNAFAGTSNDAYGISTALLNGIFSYGGFDNVSAACISPHGLC